MWQLLRARKRPARLVDELHTLWDVRAEILEGYPDMVRVTLDYGEERIVRLVVNRSGHVVSHETEETD